MITIDDLIRAKESLDKQKPKKLYLVYTQKTAEYMAKVGLAVKDENGTYWAYGTEIKIIKEI
jgi:hypothetical protein